MLTLNVDKVKMKVKIPFGPTREPVGNDSRVHDSSVAQFVLEKVAKITSSEASS